MELVNIVVFKTGSFYLVAECNPFNHIGFLQAMNSFLEIFQRLTVHTSGYIQQKKGFSLDIPRKEGGFPFNTSFHFGPGFHQLLDEFAEVLVILDNSLDVAVYSVNTDLMHRRSCVKIQQGLPTEGPG